MLSRAPSLGDRSRLAGQGEAQEFAEKTGRRAWLSKWARVPLAALLSSLPSLRFLGATPLSGTNPVLIHHGVTTHRWSNMVTPGTGLAQAQAQAIMAEVDAYEAAVGRRVTWVGFGHEWHTDGPAFPKKVALSIRRRGASPLIFLNLRSVDWGADPVYTLARILAGKYDAYLAAWADEAKKFGSELLVNWGWEMNIGQPWNGVHNGGPVEGPRRFRRAYRHIVQLIRGRGATNVRWGFHINYFPEDPDEPWNAFENYYPGDDVIDATGISIYGAQSPADTELPAFVPLMDAAYHRLTALAPAKPVYVYEFGTTSTLAGGSQVQWAQEALSAILSGRWTRLRGFAWWNDYWENDNDPSHNTEMRVEAVPGLAAAFKSLLSSGKVGERPPVS